MSAQQMNSPSCVDYSAAKLGDSDDRFTRHNSTASEPF